MSWLKQADPARGPAMPPHVDVLALHRHAQDLERRGPLPPSLAYLVASAPALRMDRWGMPLPLTDPQQARIDRIAAVLADPETRPRALLRAGQLGPDEVGALAAGRPEEYFALSAETLRDMIVAGPPLAQWVTSQLAILFQRPSADLLLPPVALEDDEGGRSHGRPASPHGTPADRRELAVRIGR